MSTHFPNRIPNCMLQDWFIIDAYFTQTDYLHYDKIKEIWDAGFRNLYISMGSKYNVQMCKYIETLSKSILDEFKEIEFSVVLFDSLNMPHENIKQLINAEMYISSKQKPSTTADPMFKTVKHAFTDDEKYFIDTYRNFRYTNDYPMVRYYYHNQIHIKSILTALKGPFTSDYDYGLKLFEYLGEMMPNNNNLSKKDTREQPSNISLNYYEMKELINCNKYINWSQSIN
jgi:hypothetical protein